MSLATHSKPKTKISQFIGVRNDLTDILLQEYICIYVEPSFMQAILPMV